MATTSNQNAQRRTQNTPSDNYVNLHTSGLGYVSRVREVAVRKGKPFMSATIRAMHGEKGVNDGMNFVPFDVKAATEEAEWHLRNLNDLMSQRPDLKVMVQFKIGDFYIDTFKYTSGEKAGQTGTMLKGRLLQIYRVWTKDKNQRGEYTGWEMVYEKPRAEAAPQEQQQVGNGAPQAADPQGDYLEDGDDHGQPMADFDDHTPF